MGKQTQRKRGSVMIHIGQDHARLRKAAKTHDEKLGTMARLLLVWALDKYEADQITITKPGVSES